MRSSLVRLMMGASLMLCALGSVAGEMEIRPSTEVTIGNERLVPHAGGWWNPDEGGSGHFFEFMQNADGSLIGFATTYTYDENGRSTFLIVQGPMTFTTEADRLATGVIARLSGPLLKAENGQPFGGTYRPATVSPSSYGTGEYVWFTRRKAEFRSNGRVTPLRPLSPLSPEAEVEKLLTGTWVLQGHVFRNPEAANFGIYERTVSHVVRIQKSAIQPAWFAGRGSVLSATALSKFWQPPSTGVMTFDVTCVSDCPPTPHPLEEPFPKFGITYDAKIWVDVNTGRAGYVTAAKDPSNFRAAYWATEIQTHPVGGGSNWTFDLFMDDDTLIGRGGVIVTYVVVPQNFHPGSEIVLMRVDAKTAPPGRKVY